MSLKRPRIHFSGISNNDFRTKGEIKKIKLFQPFHESKNFGMMGLSNYKLPLSIHKELFKPTIGINEGKYVENDIQNPKIYDSSLFYQNNSMRIKPKNILIGQRSKQLDTSEYRGGLEYNGDSMMIVETNKKRKEIKMKEKIIQENLKKKHIGVISGGIMLKHDFINNNNSAILEDDNKNRNDDDTKIMKHKRLIKSSSDGIYLDKKVSKERLNEIKNKIYNRLKTHNNTKEIFLNWQKNYLNNKELSIYDLHKIINDLGIPITYNETFAIIASSNKRNTDKLNYEEFKDIFLNDNNKTIETDFSRIPYQNESIYIENNKKEEENKKQLLNDLKISQNENYFSLQKIIRSRYPNFLQTMNKLQNEKGKNNENLNGLCDLPTFKEVLDTIKIPEKYKNDSIINTIYNQYKIPNNNFMNYEKYIENCKNIKETNDFFIFQNGYLNLIQKKLDKNEEERKKYYDILVEDQRRKKNYLKNLGNQFSMDSSEDKPSFNKRLYKNKSNSVIYLRSINNEINKNKKYSLEEENKNIDKKNMNTIEIDNINNDKKKDFYNHYQPSLNFINFVFKDNKLYNDRYYKAVDEISPLIPKKTNEKNELIKKNFSDADEKKSQILLNSRKFNKNFLSCEVGMPGYMKNEERYKKYEPSDDEKTKKLKFMKNTLKRKFDTNKEWNDKINFQQNVVDINNSLGQIKRTENLFRYEKRINSINLIT